MDEVFSALGNSDDNTSTRNDVVNSRIGSVGDERGDETNVRNEIREMTSQVLNDDGTLKRQAKVGTEKSNISQSLTI